MSLIIHFLRHCETASSYEGSFCGFLDIDLTESGRQMAEEFAEAYESLPLEVVFASPLKRAAATAEPLCRKKGIKLQLEERLKEISYGKWEGKTHEDINREFHDDYIWWLADPAWNCPTGGEKGIEVARRSSAFLEQIERTYSSGNILIVSHKATIRIMLCSLLGIDLGRFRDRFELPVGSICIIKMSAHGPSLHLMGDRSYMSEQLRTRLGT